jgi:CTP:molybdopterin cytidylyltransferase MocA
MILRPWVILLAAGGSRRFGRPKQLIMLRGETLLRRAARVALATRPAGCVIVLGAHATRLQLELDGLPVRIAVNRRWRQGLASSLRAGLDALPAAAPAALFMLADQAAVTPADLKRLYAAWRREPASIAAARADGVRGPPAILPRSLFPALRQLRGDAGARVLLADPGRRVVEVDMPAAAVDIDTPADLARIGRHRGRRGRILDTRL